MLTTPTICSADMEGAPAFYQKKHLEVTRINADGSETEQKVEPLIYIDVERPDEGVIAPEYVVWIRKCLSISIRFRDGAEAMFLAQAKLSEMRSPSVCRISMSRNTFVRFYRRTKSPKSRRTWNLSD